MNLKLLREDGTFMYDIRKDNRVRGGAKLKLIRPKYENVKRSISYKGPYLWNNLPVACKRNQLPEVFKKNLKKHIWAKFTERGSVR